MHGLSGSGKSTVAAQLSEALGAIQIRSDVVRKQLYGLEADADSDSSVNRGIYSKDATTLTYRRLRKIAQKLMASGFCAIIDASFLLRSQRQVLLDLISEGGYPCIVVECEAPVEELRKRISERKNDPSEANLQVLEQQIQKREPVLATEAGISGTVTIGDEGPREAEIDQIRALLSVKPLVDGH